MSTLSIPQPRAPHVDEVEARFAELTHRALAPRPRGVDFGTVFDLDYGEDALAAHAEQAAPPVVRQAVQPGERSTVRHAETTLVRVRRQRPRLTRRGRALLTLLFLGAALAVMVSVGGLATASLSGGEPTPVRVMEVHSGDTLYGIAGDLAEPGKVREMVRTIQDLNSLPTSTITEGQKLAVPVG